MKKIRKEWCDLNGFNYIDFESINQAERYILFLEQRIEALDKSEIVKLGCSIGCSPQRNCQLFIELGGCEKCKFFKPTDL